MSEDYYSYSVLSSIRERLSNIESSIEVLSDTLIKLMKEVRELRSKVDELSGDIAALNQNLNELSDKVTELGLRVEDLSHEVQVVKTNLNDLRKEFHEKVAVLEGRIVTVERRVSEAEKNLDEHLKKQDEVLESHSEALLNDLAFQTMSVIRSRYGESVKLTLTQLHRNPLIAIEDHRSIRLLVIAESPSEVLQDMLNKLSSRLENYTDKEVVYKILTLEAGRRDQRSLSRGEPIWTLLAEESV